MYLVQIHSGPLPKVRELQIQDFVWFSFPLPFLPSSPNGVVCKYSLLKGKKNKLTIVGDWRLPWKSCMGNDGSAQKVVLRSKIRCAVQQLSHTVSPLDFTSFHSIFSHYRWRYLQSQRRGVWNVGGSWSARGWRYSCGSSTGPGSDRALNKWLFFCLFLFLGLQTVCCFSFLNFFQVYSTILWRWL